MIKIENTIVTGWEAAIRGARMPLQSFAKSDSRYEDGYYVIGENDLEEVSFTEHRIEWLGDNNTAAVLVYSESALGNSDLYHQYLVLTYGKTDSDAMVQAVCDAVEEERVKTENQNRTNTTNGL